MVLSYLGSLPEQQLLIWRSKFTEIENKLVNAERHEKMIYSHRRFEKRIALFMVTPIRSVMPNIFIIFNESHRHFHTILLLWMCTFQGFFYRVSNQL